MDKIRMNQTIIGECPILDEELNIGMAYLLKYYDEPLWDGFTNHNKLLVVAYVFTISLDYRLSEVGYDRVVKWARSILPKGKELKENFYVAKSMMKPLGLGYQKIDMCLHVMLPENCIVEHVITQFLGYSPKYTKK